MIPEQLLNHMKSFKYGIYIENGKQHVQQPENLEKTKIGTCYDQSLYIYDKLTKAKYSCKLIFFTNSTLTITHSFVLFKENNNTYWIENAYEKFTGIHKVDNGYLDVLKVWAKDEKINANNVAVNDNVDTNKLLTNKNLTYAEYIKIVTEPFLTKEDIAMEQRTKSNDINYTQSLDIGLEALNIQNLPNIKTWYFATQDDPYDQFTIFNDRNYALASYTASYFNIQKWGNIDHYEYKVHGNSIDVDLVFEKSGNIKSFEPKKLDNVKLYNIDRNTLLEFTNAKIVQSYSIEGKKFTTYKISNLNFSELKNKIQYPQIFNVNLYYKGTTKFLATGLENQNNESSTSSTLDTINKIASVLITIIDLLDRLFDLYYKVKTKSNRETASLKETNKINAYSAKDVEKQLNNYITILKISDNNLTNIKNFKPESLPKTIGTLQSLGWYDIDIKKFSNIMKTFKKLIDINYAKYKQLNSEDKKDPKVKFFFTNIYSFLNNIKNILNTAISNSDTTMELSSTTQTFYPFCKMTNINKIDTETFSISNFETKSFNDLYLESKKIKNLLRTVELTDNSGQENFVVDGIVRLFSGIVNIVMHIVNTFKTNIFKFYKNLKRTELRYFHESNVASMRRILSFDYELLSQMQIPIPNKLSTTYYAATEAGMNCLSVMNMKERSMAFVSLTNNLKSSVLSGQTIEVMEFGDQTDLGNIQKSFQKFNLCFTGRKTNTIDFSTVFPSMEEFSNTDMLLMKSENYQYEVNEINKNLEACEARMNEILSFLNQGVGNISKQDLIVLSDTCMTLAKLFDLYGVTIQDITRLEHNFTLILKQIKHQFNL